MSRKVLAAISLLTVAFVSLVRTGLMLYRQAPVPPLAGTLHRATLDPSVDRDGHSRGQIQVDLMRQIMADRARALPAAASFEDDDKRSVSSQSHPLLGRLAPPFDLSDSRGKPWNSHQVVATGPVILVFYLGESCMACVTHLVELDFAISEFSERHAGVLAISADSPESSRQRLDRFGDFRVPLLSDTDHATALAYGVWKALPGAESDDGVPRHGTFIVDRDGIVRWAYVGDSPFRDTRVLLRELSLLDASKRPG
jgi:peroxiredoxin